MKRQRREPFAQTIQNGVLRYSAVLQILFEIFAGIHAPSRVAPMAVAQCQRDAPLSMTWLLQRHTFFFLQLLVTTNVTID